MASPDLETDAEKLLATIYAATTDDVQPMTDAARSPMMRMPAKRGLSRTEAAGYIGIGTTLFDKTVEAGQMPRPKRIGVRNV